MTPKKLVLALLAFFITAVYTAHASVIPDSPALKLPRILCDNMVLQQKQPIPVWGWSNPGDQVTVEFKGQRKRTKTNLNGLWQLKLAAVAASEQPATMTIYTGEKSISIKNILIGEVWLASGQSNMEYLMKLLPNYKKPARGADSAAIALDSAKDDKLRIFVVKKTTGVTDVVSTNGWQAAIGKPLEIASAPAYFFARQLRASLKVPVGIISSSWGGTRIEPWTPASAFQESKAFAQEASTADFKIDAETPGKYYNSMIKPLVPYGIKGVIWYQGESNCTQNETRYPEKFEAFTKSWRAAWDNSKLPVYSVLIAPYLYTRRKDAKPHTPQTLPLFWEQQLATLKVPHTELTNVSDLVDDLKEIHPSYKWEIGRRLALLALTKTYNIKLAEYTGPRFKRFKTDGNKLIVSFKHAEKLTTSNNLPPDNFSIAGADGVYYPATAQLINNQLILNAAQVSQPVNIRFAWTESATPNLVNSAGIPAFPFRTDK